jgi:hypothetical protein
VIIAIRKVQVLATHDKHGVLGVQLHLNFSLFSNCTAAVDAELATWKQYVRRALLF